MKKRHLYTVLLSVLVVLLLVSPVFAESLISPLPDKKSAEHDGCTDVSCETHSQLLHHPEFSDPVAERRYREGLFRLKDDCAHTNAVSYADMDTGETGYVCFVCNTNWGSDQVNAKSAELLTSAVIRSGCAHAYTDWTFYSDTQHYRRCELCNANEYASHNIIIASCEEDQHCHTCNARNPSWPIRLGHEYEWVYEWDLYPAAYHDYKCNRTIGLYFSCGDVKYDNLPCGDEWYVEAAVDGVHETYFGCDQCYYTYNYEYSECTYNGRIGSCGLCGDYNPFP